MPEVPEGERRAWYVREMFGAVARRYDLANRVLSAGLDRGWRRRAATACAEALPADAPRVLDLCAGTGDLGLALLARRPDGRLIACDFSRPMLERARRKFARAGCTAQTLVVEANALALPLANGSVDGVLCGFGLRNLGDPARGLAEMARAVRPGGPVVILEFHRPRGRGLLAGAFGLYFHRILPRLGALVSGGDRGGYRYLVESIEAFGPPEATTDAMAGAGLEAIRVEPLRGGIASVYFGRRPR